MTSATNPASNPTEDDPVLIRRANIARAVLLGKRVGYSLFALAIVVFFFGFFGRLTDTKVTIIVASMLIGSVILAPAIVFGYGVAKAVREESDETGGGH